MESAIEIVDFARFDPFLKKFEWPCADLESGFIDVVAPCELKLMQYALAAFLNNNALVEMIIEIQENQ